jgi:ferredoxin--NADP+ reductase
MSVIRNPEVYERFETVILVHSVRRVSELAYSSYIEEQLPQNEFLGEAISRQLRYYPTVTREPFRNRGRITDLIDSGKLFDDLGQPPLDPDCDRAMLCGSASLLADLCTLLDARGMRISPRQGEAGDYVIERAFVET